jgi:hypothetical protein
MLDDIRHGVITVLVCWHDSRIERRGGKDLLKILADVDDAGGSIYSAQQGKLGIKTMGERLSSFVYGEVSQDFIANLTANVKLSYDRIRANGAVGPGGIPWGFNLVGEKYHKKLVPTDLCREYAPQIFEHCADGDSCRTIAIWLDQQGVPPKRGDHWHEGTVRKLIQNRVYAGRWQDAAKTRTLYTVPNPPVKAELWERANKALSSRPHRGPVNEANRPMLAGLKCNRCDDSPMFRIRLKSRSGKYYYYYRCTGRGAQRKGCGNMLPYDLLDTYVYAWVLLTAKEPHMIRTWIEGKNWESEKADLTQDMHEAINAGQFDKLTELQAQMQELEAREVTPGRPDEIDSGITKGQYFHSLGRNGQREYLRAHDIRAEKDSRYADGVRLVIDGKDVTPYLDVDDRLRAALAAKGSPWGQRVIAATVSAS